MAQPSQFIDGQWAEGTGSAFESHDPASGELVWQGASAGAGEIDGAVAAARRASETWAELSIEQRIGFLTCFAEGLRSRRSELAEAISTRMPSPASSSSWNGRRAADGASASPKPSRPGG